MVPDQSNPPFPIAGHGWVPETTTWIGPLSPISFSLSSFPSSQSFFEVQVNTSVILRVVVVLLVLELCFLGLRFESPANCLRSESGFQIEKPPRTRLASPPRSSGLLEGASALPRFSLLLTLGSFSYKKLGTARYAFVLLRQSIAQLRRCPCYQDWEPFRLPFVGGEAQVFRQHLTESLHGVPPEGFW